MEKIASNPVTSVAVMVFSALSHTFWHFFAHFHTFLQFFKTSPPGLSLRIKGFYCCQGPLNGGVSNGGVSRSGLVRPFFVLFCPFLGLSRFFRDFPDLLGDGPRIFPIRPFSLKSTYEEHSRKGPRHDPDLSRKKVGNPRVWKPAGLASLNTLVQRDEKRITENKKKKTKPFCTLVVVRLSSSKRALDYDA